MCMSNNKVMNIACDVPQCATSCTLLCAPRKAENSGQKVSFVSKVPNPPGVPPTSLPMTLVPHAIASNGLMIGHAEALEPTGHSSS